MAKFCINCGMEIKDGIAFCTECGTPAPSEAPQQSEAPTQFAENTTSAQSAEKTAAEAPVHAQAATAVMTSEPEAETPSSPWAPAQSEPAPAPSQAYQQSAPSQSYQQPAPSQAFQQPTPPTYQQPVQSQPYQQTAPQPAYQQPAQPQYQQPAPPPTYQQPVQPMYQQSAPSQAYQQTMQQDVKPTGKYAVVGTGAFFGMMLLFAIPVVGWIACIIMSFAPKNQNIKHYSRAMLFWVIIGILISIALFFLFSWVSDMLIKAINDASGGTFGDWNEMFGELSQFSESGFDISEYQQYMN